MSVIDALPCGRSSRLPRRVRADQAFSASAIRSPIVSSRGGRTQVKAKRVSLEDGKLSTESFEGELDGRAHDDAVRRAQQEVLEEAAPLLRMLRWMLPMR